MSILNICWLLLFCASGAIASAQSAWLSGQVVDLAGRPVPGATVSVLNAEATQISDADGRFRLTLGATANTELTARTSDGRRGKVIVPQHATEVRIVVQPAVNAGLEFTDKPNFTLAGITDWTAVGGHGSDATLRTSEELARQAARTDSNGSGKTLTDLQQRATAARASGREAEYHSLKGELDEANGDPLGAVQEEARAVALEPTERNYHAWGSELLLHRAVWQAAQVFGDGLKHYPESVSLRTGLGAALFAEAKYDDAAQELCKASDLAPANQEAYRSLGKLALGSPELAKCVAEKLRRWIHDNPASAEANYFAGRMLEREGSDNKHAVVLLQQAVKLNPELADAWLQLGILAAGAQDNAAAERDLRAAIAADPRLAEAHYRLGVLEDRTGRKEEAKQEFAEHRRLKEQDAARTEQERREVKQFVIAGEAAK